MTDSSSAQLAAAAQLENRNPIEAIRAYQRIASAATDPDRGEALVALGALLRRQRRFDEALRAYRDLEMLGPVPVAGGQPAALVAKQGRAETFLESGGQLRLRQEAGAFARELSAGGWLIDRASFELYQHDMIEPRAGHPQTHRRCGGRSLLPSCGSAGAAASCRVADAALTEE